VESFRHEFESLGHEVYIFAPKWKGYTDNNPRVFRYPSVDIKIKIRFPLAIPYSRKIDNILENLDLDIIHSQHPNLLGSAAMRFAKKKNIPIVFTWHTLYDQYAHFAPFVPRRLAAWWAIRNAKNYANKCDAVITPTPSVIEIIRNWGVTNKNIFAIPTGVEEKEISNFDRVKVREKYAIMDDEILLTLITRFTEEKNTQFVFDALKDVLRANPKVKFMAVGDGYLLPELKAYAKKNKLESKVIFSGFISWEELRNYFAAGDIFVYGSKSETQGTVLTEAMYSGLPIVAVRATGVRDIVEDGKTGFLVSEDKAEFQTAVQKLIDNENLRKNFGEEAKRVAREKYTAKICAQKMLKVYEESRTLKNF
jgi:glycosyltransferase involved in cell wall biosynthesis